MVDAVPLALSVAASEWATGMAATIRRAVSLGGDADTVASMAGQLAGAAGVDVPSALLDKIHGIRDVESAIARFTVQVATNF